jgi:hypothetical protein
VAATQRPSPSHTMVRIVTLFSARHRAFVVHGPWGICPDPARHIPTTSIAPDIRIATPYSSARDVANNESLASTLFFFFTKLVPAKNLTLHASRHRVISYYDKGRCEPQSHWKLTHYQPSPKAEFG